MGETLTVTDHSGGDWTALAERLDGMGEVRWSVCVRDGDGQVVFAHRPDDVLSTASVGKLFLLVEVARQLDEGLLPADVPLQRTDELAVGDSGLWQYLKVEALAPEDLAVLVAAVSDNLATNVLLHRVGLDAVHRATANLGIARSALHDRVRDQRTPATAERLSSGTAFELSGVFAELGSANASLVRERDRLLGWLSASVDLSMVASAFGLDPLSHGEPDRGLTLWNKTGTDAGVRADVGLVRTADAAFSYAVIANWRASDPRDEVLGTMAEVGRAMKQRLDASVR